MMRDHLDDDPAMTDRHRAGLAAGRPQRPDGPSSSSSSKPASSRTGTPSCSALSALEPAFSPTTT